MDTKFKISEGIKNGDVRRISTGLGYVKMCTSCKTPKSMVGGTNKNKKFVCKACKKQKEWI